MSHFGGVAKARPSTSHAIKNARVLCIFAVMYVHVYSGFAGGIPVGNFGPEDVWYRFATDVLGRSSVPLLTVISGWLFMQSAKPYAALLKAKLNTLVLPLIGWGLVMLAVMDAAGRTLPPLYDGLLALTAQPANRPLGFLRDLFVVMLLSPLIASGVRAWGLGFVAATALVAIAFPYTPILLRTQLLFFFSLGAWLQERRVTTVRPEVLALAAYYALALFAVELWTIAHGGAWTISPAIELVQRTSVAALFWAAAVWLCRYPSLARLEPYTFLAFCSHFIVFRVLSITGVTVASPLYPAFFTVQPVIGFVVAIGLGIVRDWVIAEAKDPVARRSAKAQGKDRLA